jgi:hypothetical protein
MSAYEPRYSAFEPKPVHQADQGTTAPQARVCYLRAAGGGLVAAMLGSITRPPENPNPRRQPFPDLRRRSRWLPVGR